MRGKLFARGALIAALLAPAAVWADSGSGSGASSSTSTHKAHAPITHGKAAINPKSAKETLSDADLKILSHVHDVNVNEIEMGQLASLRATDKAVKAYADMIVKDHQKADKDVMALAKARSATLATTPSDSDEVASQQKAMETMDRLRGMTGAQFDREFLAAMADGHDRELVQADDSIKNATDTRLQALVKGIRPTLAKHATRAKTLLAKQTKAAGAGSNGESYGSGAGSASDSGSPRP